MSEAAGLLGDTTARDYAGKLRLFNAFAEPELRRAITGLGIERGTRILDAGCGTGETLRWLAAATDPDGFVVGLDLARAHIAAASTAISARVAVVQADLLHPPLAPHSFDLVWAVNAVNHLHDPGAGIARLTELLASGGRLALGQSSLLPDMYFAWDSRLERLTNEAVRRYYQDRYGLEERDLAGVRAIVGLLRRAGLREVTVSTLVLERVAPLAAPDEAYILEAIFRGSWGERLRPYLPSADYEELARVCDPAHPGFALKRPDFHFLQTFTLAVGSV
jgi:SAM-dependent methyltransferase